MKYEHHLNLRKGWGGLFWHETKEHLIMVVHTVTRMIYLWYGQRLIAWWYCWDDLQFICSMGYWKPSLIVTSQHQSRVFSSKIPQLKNFTTQKLSPRVSVEVQFEVRTPKQRCRHICLAHTVVNGQPVSRALWMTPVSEPVGTCWSCPPIGPWCRMRCP